MPASRVAATAAAAAAAEREADERLRAAEDADDEEVDEEDDDAEDEYKNVDARGETFELAELPLECGRVLKRVQCRYRTFGSMNAARDNVMVVCHALTGNASLDEWWGDMLGAGKLFDDTRLFIVCANVLGSCYGTTGPTSVDPATGEPYGATFPDITVRDSVNLHIRLVRDHLRAQSVACVVGGSLGGMQTLEWALLGGPDFVRCLMPMSCGAAHSPWQIAISEAQRQAIYADPDWHGGEYARVGVKPARGLAVARAMAMITYRSHAGYERKFARREVGATVAAAARSKNGLGTNADPQQQQQQQHKAKAGHGQERFFQVESYLRHQGRKFVERFDALSYVKVTRLMDAHDVGRGRPGGTLGALQALVQPALVISVSSDALYPPVEQETLAAHMPQAQLVRVDSDHGHDGFLLCQQEIMAAARPFLEEHVYARLQQQTAKL